MRMAIALSVALLLSTSAQGASVSIDAFCQTDLIAGGSITQTVSIRRNVPTMGGCSIGMPPESFPDPDPFFGEEFASAQGGVDYGVTSGEFNLTGFAHVRAHQPFISPQPQPVPESHSHLILVLDLLASSVGPPRPGLIDLLIAVPPFSDPGGSDILVSFQVGSIFVLVDNGGGGLSGIFPITLGDLFVIGIEAEGGAGAETQTGQGNRRAGFVLNFRLTELDGTPVGVELFPVPEPSTLLLLTSILPVLLRKYVRRSGHGSAT